MALEHQGSTPSYRVTQRVEELPSVWVIHALASELLLGSCRRKLDVWYQAGLCRYNALSGTSRRIRSSYSIRMEHGDVVTCTAGRNRRKEAGYTFISVAYDSAGTHLISSDNCKTSWPCHVAQAQFDCGIDMTQLYSLSLTVFLE